MGSSVGITASSVPVSKQHRVAAEPAPLASLAGTPMSDRFCFWRGRSGRRYVFSVYDTRSRDGMSASEYRDAIVIEAERRADGGRSVVRIGFTGALAGLMTTSWSCQGSTKAAVERHVHLLAGSAAERRALLSDLCSVA